MALFAAAVAYRLWAVVAEVPAGAGDEAVTGIVAPRRRADRVVR